MHEMVRDSGFRVHVRKPFQRSQGDLAQLRLCKVQEERKVAAV